jgi:hypothetical protein
VVKNYHFARKYVLYARGVVNLMPRYNKRMGNDRKTPIADAANALAEEHDADIFLYNSSINRPFDEEVITKVCGRKRRKNAIFFLVTEGGDADAAYRIARSFQDHYGRFVCVVAGYCKSAGSLILTGSHQVVIFDAGELGPLDVQMVKKDELGERESGLLVTSALEALRRSTFSSFEHFFLTIKRRSRFTITFKTAAEYASKLTTGLFAPIYEQIDPMRVAESSRAQAIASQYGARLSAHGRNIDSDGLERLIGGYPTHGFVIDRTEASELFRDVREPSEKETQLVKALGRLGIDPLPEDDAYRDFLSTEVGVTANDETTQNDENQPDAGPDPI